jgi:hypothetical protein
MNKRISLAAVATLAVALIALPLALADTSGNIRTGNDGNTGRIGKLKTTYDSSSVHTQHVNIDSVPFASTNVHAPASNTAAVVTYAAVAGKKHVISGLIVSYSNSGTLAGGNIKIEDVSGTTVFSADIFAKGTYFFPFPTPMRGNAANTALIVTLAAGGATVDGKLTVLGYHTE